MAPVSRRVFAAVENRCIVACQALYSSSDTSTPLPFEEVIVSQVNGMGLPKKVYFTGVTRRTGRG